MSLSFCSDTLYSLDMISYISGIRFSFFYQWGGGGGFEGGGLSWLRLLLNLRSDSSAVDLHLSQRDGPAAFGLELDSSAVSD